MSVDPLPTAGLRQVLGKRKGQTNDSETTDSETATNLKFLQDVGSARYVDDTPSPISKEESTGQMSSSSRPTEALRKVFGNRNPLATPRPSVLGNRTPVPDEKVLKPVPHIV
jgi:hypothetical protein